MNALRRLRSLRRLARLRTTYVVVSLAALSLLALHTAFHLTEWRWWPPPDVLQALFGAHDVGRVFHAATEVIVILALLAGLWTVVVERPARWTDEYVADAEKGVMLLLATELPIDALREAFAADRDELSGVKDPEHQSPVNRKNGETTPPNS